MCKACGARDWLVLKSWAELPPDERLTWLAHEADRLNMRLAPTLAEIEALRRENDELRTELDRQEWR